MSQNKFHNRKTEYNGRLYDSAKEAKHAGFLDICKRAEKPSDRVVFWLPQVPFRFQCGNKMIVDFLVCFADGHYELHDVKGWDKRKKKWITKTSTYNLKKRMLKHEYGIEIREV